MNLLMTCWFLSFLKCENAHTRAYPCGDKVTPGLKCGECVECAVGVSIQDPVRQVKGKITHKRCVRCLALNSLYSVLDGRNYAGLCLTLVVPRSLLLVRIFEYDYF